MNQFDNFDFQVILYSKGWYKETNTLEDIRQIIHKISWTDLKYISDLDVLRLVSKVAHKVLAVKGITDNDLQIIYIDPWKSFFETKTHITILEQVESLLRVIRYKPQDNYPTLPGPSEEYLPVPKEKLDHWMKMNIP